MYGHLERGCPRGIPKSTKPLVQATMVLPDGTTKTILALVDTGAQVNLVNPNGINQEFFAPSKKPVKLGAANSLKLQGGAGKLISNCSSWAMIWTQKAQ